MCIRDSESSAHVAKELRDVEQTNIRAIKNHILEITPTGGTNMEAGYNAGTRLLRQYEQADKGEYENRIIFLTDAMPNPDTDKSGVNAVVSISLG